MIANSLSVMSPLSSIFFLFISTRCCLISLIKRLSTFSFTCISDQSFIMTNIYHQ